MAFVLKCFVMSFLLCILHSVWTWSLNPHLFCQNQKPRATKPVALSWSLSFFSFRVSISQRLRVMGSLLFIMFVFILTAVLVKVPLEPLPFFSITMVTIVIINCEFCSFYVDTHKGCTVGLWIDECIDWWQWVLQGSVNELVYWQPLERCCRAVCLVWLGCCQLPIQLPSWVVRGSPEVLLPSLWSVPSQVWIIMYM